MYEIGNSTNLTAKWKQELRMEGRGQWEEKNGEREIETEIHILRDNGDNVENIISHMV